MQGRGRRAVLVTRVVLCNWNLKGEEGMRAREGARAVGGPEGVMTDGEGSGEYYSYSLHL